MKLPVNVEHTVSWDNTTMITVQKLINYISSYVDHSLLQVFHLVHCGEEDTAPLNGNALDGNVLKSSVHRGLSFQSAFIQNLYEEDIVAADLSNISAQGVGILFAATMRCVYPANDLLRPQPSLVQCSSSSHDSIHSPSQREPVTSNETYGRFFGDMTSATRSIALAAQNFTDSSIFFIMDYFVGCLRRLGESCAGPNCVGIASPLLSTCETAFAYFLKSCRFLRRYL